MRGRGSDDEAPHNEAASEQSHVETLLLSKKESSNLDLLRQLIEIANQEGVFTVDDLIDAKYTEEGKDIKDSIKNMKFGVHLTYLVKQGEIREVTTALGQKAYKIIDAQDSSDDDESAGGRGEQRGIR